MRIWFAVLPALLLAGCGGGSATVTVDLAASADAVLNPFDPGNGLSKVRIRIDGTEQADDAIRDLPLGQRQAVFEKFPTGMEVEIRADGLDEFGNVVAFGRAEQLTIEEDTSVTIPFRRNLAYVIHEASELQRQPEAHLYLIDVSSRTLVRKVKLPGTTPRARGISARGGVSILVTYDEGGQTFVGVMSADSNEIRSLPLMRAQTLAIASPQSPTAVVAGGGVISFLDLDSGANELFPMQVGGRVLDAAISPDGGRAIVVLDSAALDIDVDRRTVKQISILPNPSGVAIGFGGRVAYLTSSTEGIVGQINLTGQDAAVITGASFVRPVVGATFSDANQAIFAVNVNPTNGSARVLSFIVFPEPEGLSLEEGTQALNFPSGIASDATGRRIVVVSAGTSSATAGLTVIDAAQGQIPDGSSTLYPLDPDDTFLSRGGVLLKQRWRPLDVAVIYGR